MHGGILKIIATSGFLTATECTKFVFGRGSAPDPAGGVYDAPPDPLVGWGGGNPLPIPHLLDASGISPFDAFGVSYPRRRLCPPLSKVWLRRWRWHLGGLKLSVLSNFVLIDLTYCVEDIGNSIFLTFGLKSPNAHAHFLESFMGFWYPEQFFFS